MQISLPSALGCWVWVYQNISKLILDRSENIFDIGIHWVSLCLMMSLIEPHNGPSHAIHHAGRCAACSIHFVKLASISWSHTQSSRTDPGWLRGAIHNLCISYVSVISQLQAVVTCYNILREAVVLSGTFRHIYILPRNPGVSWLSWGCVVPRDLYSCILTPLKYGTSNQYWDDTTQCMVRN